jgi:hypothetical protein
MPYRRHPTDHRDARAPSSENAWDFHRLVAWQRDGNFSDQQAADELALSLSAFRRQRSGRSPVSGQTVKLALRSAVVDLQKLLSRVPTAIAPD